MIAQAAAQGPTLGSLLVLAALAIVPLLLVSCTSFVKASVVLSLLRNALGAPGVPSAVVIAALAALLSAYVMAPVARSALSAAAVPLSALELDAPVGGPQRDKLLQVLELARAPLAVFLERNAGERERALFVELGQRGTDPSSAPQATDLVVLLPAFLITELKEALQIGLLLLLPFVVIDLVTTSVLTALGMTSLSAGTVALPLKLLLFLSVDGFAALSRALVTGYAY